MREMPSIQLVKAWYVKSFEELRNAPVPNTIGDEANFARYIYIYNNVYI